MYVILSSSFRWDEEVAASNVYLNPAKDQKYSYICSFVTVEKMHILR